MPKRKTADAKTEPAAPAEARKRSLAPKPKTPAAATHKRTPRIAKAEVATPVAIPVETAIEDSVPATTVAVAAATPSRFTAHIPTRHEIAILAYSYWESRGYQGGSPDEDWFRAERELLELAQDR